MDDGIPATNVPVLDVRANLSRSFRQKLVAIDRLGYDVIEDTKSLARGEFDLHAKTFTYNPETMTRLDLAHEWRHYKQLVRLRKRGLRFRSRGSSAAEVGAYRYEQRLWERIGQSPGDDYLKFHKEILAKYLGDFNSFRTRQFLNFHPDHREVFR